MNYTMYPKPLSGVINAPSSKSIMHRVLICASFAKGNSIIENPLYSYDTVITMKALESIGVTFKQDGEKLVVIPPKNYKFNENIIECGNSASTARFLIPLFTSLFTNVVFKGDKRLIERLDTTDLTELPAEFLVNEQTINISNIANINNVTIHNKNTSQLISGLLFLIAIIYQKGTLHLITSDNKIDPYIELTMDVLSNFGVKIEMKHQDNLFIININKHLKTSYSLFNNASLKPTHYYIEGDYSSAANILALGLLGENIIVKNLYQTSKQGDKSFIDILKKMNAEFQIGIDAIRALNSNLNGTNIDLTYIPDLGPLLMGIACVSKGRTTIQNYKRLLLKESNRLDNTINILKSLGAIINIVNDSIIIDGQEQLNGGVAIDPCNDHRLLMMVVALTSKYKERVTILNAECVKKSYPNFWDDYRKLKGIVVVATPEEGAKTNYE